MQAHKSTHASILMHNGVVTSAHKIPASASCLALNNLNAYSFSNSLQLAVVVATTCMAVTVVCGRWLRLSPLPCR